jgi:ABC-2 type transport system ATP-binding protein
VLVSTHYMDEAERCHKLGYILNGRLLAQGTADDIIASQALVAWSVSGPGLAELAPRLRALPAVDQVAAFGSELHVTGTDAAALDAHSRHSRRRRAGNGSGSSRASRTCSST